MKIKSEYLQGALLFAIAVCIVIWLTGCATNRLDRQATPEDKAACEAAVAPYKGVSWLVAYRDCLKAKGYK